MIFIGYIFHLICSDPAHHGVSDVGELAGLGADLADTITSITSESSGVVSGLTSSVTSDRDIEAGSILIRFDCNILTCAPRRRRTCLSGARSWNTAAPHPPSRDSRAPW